MRYTPKGKRPYKRGRPPLYQSRTEKKIDNRKSRLNKESIIKRDNEKIKPLDERFG